MRDFNREAPGRRTKSASTINAAATAIRRLEERSFTAPLLKLRGASSLSYKLKRTLPARLIEKVQNDFAQEQNAISPRSFPILIIRRFKRPIDEHGAPNDIFLGNKSPVAAVEAHAAMVAHGKVVVRRNDNVVAMNVRRQVDHPVADSRWDRRSGDTDGKSLR